MTRHPPRGAAQELLFPKANHWEAYDLRRNHPRRFLVGHHEFLGRNLLKTLPLHEPVVPALLTTDEVAHVLRTSRKAIYTMVERRQLPGIVRLGRRVLVRQDALLDWLRQKSTPSLER